MGSLGTGQANNLQLMQAHSNLKMAQLREEYQSSVGDAPDSATKLPSRSQVQQIDGRSPGLKHANNSKLNNHQPSIDQQQVRGKTFTTTRLGNFSNG